MGKRPQSEKFGLPGFDQDAGSSKQGLTQKDTIIPNSMANCCTTDVGNLNQLLKSKAGKG